MSWLSHSARAKDERFEPGTVIVHRDLQRGRVWYARAEIVVEDREAVGSLEARLLVP